MSVLLIVGLKCTLTASHVVPWWVTVSMPIEKTYRRTPDRYMLFDIYGHRLDWVQHLVCGVVISWPTTISGGHGIWPMCVCAFSVLYWPSLFMPASRHLASRHALHWLRWALSTGQLPRAQRDLHAYWRLFRIERCTHLQSVPRRHTNVYRTRCTAKPRMSPPGILLY